MEEALSAIGAFRKLPLGAMVGVVVGAVLHRAIGKWLGLEFHDVLLVCGFVGLTLARIVEAVIFDPFVRPLERRIELYFRLMEFGRMASWLSPDAANEVRKKLVLAYLVPRKGKE